MERAAGRGRARPTAGALQRIERRVGRLVGAVAGVIALGGSAVVAASISHVTLANVTPSSFSVVWRAPASTPSLGVFADSAGAVELTGQLAVEFYPIETGSPGAYSDYDQRQFKADLRRETRDQNLVHVRVSGCQPGATYYYRPAAIFADGMTQGVPGDGPLPAVTLPLSSAFVVNSQQLVLDVPGVDTFGRIVLLSHPDAAHALAAVVGDGTGTNQVFFSLNDLFALGGGQFDPQGNQQFTLELLGRGRTSVVEQFTVEFTDAFTIAQASLAAFGLDYVTLRLGSTAVLAGDRGGVAISLDSSEGLAALSVVLGLDASRFEQLVLTDLATGIDPDASGVVRSSPASCRLDLVARHGQRIPAHGTLVQLGFTAPVGSPSGILTIQGADLAATLPDGTPIVHRLSQSGRIVIVGDQPVLEATRGADGARELTLFGHPGSVCAIESSVAPAEAASWSVFTRIPLTAVSAAVPGVESGPPTAFYRAIELAGGAPFLTPTLDPDGTRALVVYGQAAGEYTLLQTTDFSQWATWQPVLTYTLTGASRRIELPAAPESVIYRVRRE